MAVLHHIALYIHIILGAFALVLFWIPVFARKGSSLHKRAGRGYVNAMWIIALTGLFMSALVWWDPLAIRLPNQYVTPEKALRVITSQRIFAEFLFMLSLLVLVSVKHASLVLRAKADRSLLKRWTHLGWIVALMLTGVTVTYSGIVGNHILLLIFGPVSILSSGQILHYIYKPCLPHRAWIIEHFTSIIGSGIGVYTAFFAFGGRAWLQHLVTGDWQLLLWVLPGVIGILATTFYKPGVVAQYQLNPGCGPGRE